MQIAKGLVVLAPESAQFKYDITPAEALILHRLHYKNSNGTPLKDFTIYGEAVTVEVPAKARQAAWFNPQSGKEVPEVPEVPAVTHSRSNSEEVSRLKRKYTGSVKTDDGKNVPVFAAVFGSSTVVKLPQTFDEIEEAVGMRFASEMPAAPTAARTPKDELAGKSKAELVDIATGNGVPIDGTETKAELVKAILAAAGYQPD